jgi:hypothetical protein
VALLTTVTLGQAAEVIIVAGNHTFHAKGCAQISGYSASYLRTVERSSLDKGYTACPVCQPDAAAATPKTVTPAELEEFWSRYDPAEAVAIVTGSQATGLYHRRGCFWLSGASVQGFTRKDADARYFQPHRECMRQAPETYTKPAGSVASPGAAPSPTAAAPQRLLGGEPVERAPQRANPRIEASRQQCAATTRKGTRCSRLAQPGRAYCWQH